MMHQATDTGELISIQVAKPKAFEHEDGEWTTGFFKQPIFGRVRVGETNIDGDGQADLKHHGGIDKAVLAYSADHYPFWTSLLDTDMPFGGFGENLTIAGIDEQNTCIGDQWQIAEVVLEISQPRQPCWKLGRRWNNKQLPKLVIQNGRSGWYFRVKHGGVVTAREQIILLSRPHPTWTIARANDVFYRGQEAERHMLVEVEELSPTWKKALSG